MKKTFDNKRVPGLIMAIVGFVLIIITALNYLFGWKLGVPPAAIGIVFVAIGMGWIRKAGKQKAD